MKQLVKWDDITHRDTQKHRKKGKKKKEDMLHFARGKWEIYLADDWQMM